MAGSVPIIPGYTALQRLSVSAAGEVWQLSDSSIAVLVSPESREVHSRFSRLEEVQRRSPVPGLLYSNEQIWIETGRRCAFLCRCEIKENFVDLRTKGRPPPSKIKKYITALCQSISGLHSLQLMHRGVHPTNLLLTSDDGVLLSCLGHFRDFPSPEISVSAIPEAVFQPPEQVYDARVDVWGVGCVAYFLYTGEYLRVVPTQSQLAAIQAKEVREFVATCCQAQDSRPCIDDVIARCELVGGSQRPAPSPAAPESNDEQIAVPLRAQIAAIIQQAEALRVGATAFDAKRVADCGLRFVCKVLRALQTSAPTLVGRVHPDLNRLILLAGQLLQECRQL